MFGARYFGARYFGGRFFGKRGLVVEGSYAGARYFGKRYFATRYFGGSKDSNPLSLVQTNVLTMLGTLLTAAPGSLLYTAQFNLAQTNIVGLFGTTSLGGAFSFDAEEFVITPPLDLNMMSGTVLVSGNLTITVGAVGVGGYFGGRYFGRRYYGRRYWGTVQGYSMAQTNVVAMSGVCLAAGNINTELGIAQTNTLEFAGVVGAAGDIAVDAPTQTPVGGYGRGKKKRYISKVGNQLVVVDAATEAEAINRLDAKLAELEPATEVSIAAIKAVARKADELPTVNRMLRDKQYTELMALYERMIDDAEVEMLLRSL